MKKQEIIESNKFICTYCGIDPIKDFCKNPKECYTKKKVEFTIKEPSAVSAEEIENLIKHESHEYFKRGQLGFEKSADTERAFYKGAKWMQTYAQQTNAEAMREHAIGFGIWMDENNFFKDVFSDNNWITLDLKYSGCEFTDKELYTEYLNTLTTK